jgi:hypothetical protein
MGICGSTPPTASDPRDLPGSQQAATDEAVDSLDPAAFQGGTVFFQGQFSKGQQEKKEHKAGSTFFEGKEGFDPEVRIWIGQGMGRGVVCGLCVWCAQDLG